MYEKPLIIGSGIITLIFGLSFLRSNDSGILQIVNIASGIIMIVLGVIIIRIGIIINGKGDENEKDY